MKSSPQLNMCPLLLPGSVFSLSKNQIVATFADNSFWGLSTTPNQLTLDAGLSSSTMKVLFLFLTTVGALNDTQECSNVSALFCFFCLVHLHSVYFWVTALNLHRQTFEQKQPFSRAVSTTGEVPWQN